MTNTIVRALTRTFRLARERTLMSIAALTAATLLVSGCVTNTEGPQPSATLNIDSISVNERAAALLPKEVRDRGVLRIGVDASYAPNQFEGPDGAPRGWEVELTTALAAKLGLRVEWTKLLFDQIIPQVTGGTLDLGSSSFNDTVERQQQVDFVDFYEAGLQFARGPDEPALTGDLCGLSISVQTTTTSDDYVTEESNACVEAGRAPIDVLRSDNQDEATYNAMIGRASYMLADSPITQFAVSRAEGKLVFDGDIFDAAPYGLVCQKDSPTTEAIRAAMQSLMDDGTYEKVLTAWGVEAGALKRAEINGVS